MNTIDSEIAAYQGMKEELEAKHMGKWALVKGGELVSLFGSFDEAAETAVRKFGSGPYLIRQIGAPPVTIPASLMYQI